MKTQFTKGEWTYNKFKDEKRVFEIDCLSGNWIGLARCYYTKGDKKTGRANAKLIAAAPDLFKAVNSLLFMLGEIDYDSCGAKTIEDSIHIAVDAIKKATE